MATKQDNRVGEQPRRFRCKVTCYWNGTRYYGEDRVQQGGKVSEIEFQPGTEIPKNFQWENWEEF
jgi:hypothetical protein